jgi:hypothetical protein
MSTLEEEEEFVPSEEDESTTELKGYLFKWTNFLNGWQSRFVVLNGFTLSYYLSAQGTSNVIAENQRSRLIT